MSKKQKYDEMRFEVYYMPGICKDKKDYIAITSDCLGGFACGKTKNSAVSALRRIYGRYLKNVGR